MLWFSMQSLLMLLLAFVVGLLVGWLAWGRQWQPVQDAADLDDAAPHALAGARDGVPAAQSYPDHTAPAERPEERSRLDALLASLTQPDEARSTPVVGVAPRATSETVAAMTVAIDPTETSGDGFVGVPSPTRQGAAEAVSRIAAAAQRVAERPEAHSSEHGLADHGPADHGPADHGPADHGPADHGSVEHGPAEHAGAQPPTGSFRTTFEPTTDPFGLALAPVEPTPRTTTGEVTLAAFGEHLLQATSTSTSGRPRSESVFHEDDDLMTVLNQSNHAPATLDPGPAMIDDLTRIEGVNSAMAAALAAEGLRTYENIAQATEDQLRRALRIARIRSAPGIGFWAPRAAKLVQQRATDGASTDGASAPVADTELVSVEPADVEVGVEPVAAEPADLEPADVEPADATAGEDDTTDHQGSVAADEAAVASAAALPAGDLNPEVPSELPSDEAEFDEGTFDSLLSEPLTAADYADGAADLSTAADHAGDPATDEAAAGEAVAGERASDEPTDELTNHDAAPDDVAAERRDSRRRLGHHRRRGDRHGGDAAVGTPGRTDDPAPRRTGDPGAGLRLAGGRGRPRADRRRRSSDQRGAAGGRDHLVRAAGRSPRPRAAHHADGRRRPSARVPGDMVGAGGTAAAGRRRGRRDLGRRPDDRP